MRGFVAPKFTKEDVRKFLSDEDIKQILEIMGYDIIPKEHILTSYESNSISINSFIISDKIEFSQELEHLSLNLKDIESSVIVNVESDSSHKNSFIETDSISSEESFINYKKLDGADFKDIA